MFEIISFGTRYKVSSPASKGYKNEDGTIKRVKAEIDTYGADMGGTEIYEPLDYTIN